MVAQFQQQNNKVVPTKQTAYYPLARLVVTIQILITDRTERRALVRPVQ